MSDHNPQRRQLLKVGAVGLLGVLTGCSDVLGRDPEGALGDGTSDESIIVVGAGPAGMTAAHLLHQRGASVRVLEALDTHGGRIAHDLEFVDFPISLGAEWIHVDRSILDDIVADDSVAVETTTVGYSDDDIVGSWDGDAALTLEALTGWDDLKFVGSSWLDFFNAYIVPRIASLITYNTPIERIQYGDDGIVVTDRAGATYRADRVVVTAPLKVLQLDMITFDPPLPEGHRSAIENTHVWSGLKAFIEFDEAFYPTALAPPDSEERTGERLYYDAAYGQNSNHNVLGLFSVGVQAERYQAAGERAIDLMLDELDEVFDGAASRSYVRHLVQNWNEQPFARGAYLESYADYRQTRELAKPVADRVFFAGDAYTAFDDWSSVHTAAWSARDAVREILG